MSDLLEAIKARRAVRKYTDQAVEREKIDKVIEAGLYAANGKGQQAPYIIAITNQDLRERLSTLNREIGGWEPPFDPFYGAPVVLLVVVDEDYKNRVYDGSLVMGNMMLEASSLGLGSCWIHRARETMKSRLGQEILKLAGLTDKTYEGIAFCILGYPAEVPQAAPRREGRVRVIE
ncbi:MAG: nitroreductase [Candidatus Anaerobiospirillum merdipullorum]|uniref:Nitroreductase n=1 Tax=Candidatus Anaerobiospirillum merdipullorum TaxID=2838450 RepID=A0A9E2KMX3_9GAMM|nr:nitroreductase [Candidatus Anaerobiospirillum merdipullorum]